MRARGRALSGIARSAAAAGRPSTRASPIGLGFGQGLKRSLGRPTRPERLAPKRDARDDDPDSRSFPRIYRRRRHPRRRYYGVPSPSRRARRRRPARILRGSERARALAAAVLYRAPFLANTAAERRTRRPKPSLPVRSRRRLALSRRLRESGCAAPRLQAPAPREAGGECRHDGPSRPSIRALQALALEARAVSTTFRVYKRQSAGRTAAEAAVATARSRRCRPPQLGRGCGESDARKRRPRRVRPDGQKSPRAISPSLFPIQY